MENGKLWSDFNIGSVNKKRREAPELSKERAATRRKLESLQELKRLASDLGMTVEEVAKHL